AVYNLLTNPDRGERPPAYGGCVGYCPGVRIDRIYTRGGDAGQTSLGDGERVSKNDPRIWAYGTVDETGAAIGVAVATGLEARLANDEGRADVLWQPGASVTDP